MQLTTLATQYAVDGSKTAVVSTAYIYVNTFDELWPEEYCAVENNSSDYRYICRPSTDGIPSQKFDEDTYFVVLLITAITTTRSTYR